MATQISHGTPILELRTSFFDKLRKIALLFKRGNNNKSIDLSKYSNEARAAKIQQQINKANANILLRYSSIR
ncbi:MAG: hypothetical protein ACXAD7_04460 [Candidatus Kariarchaeaceae archaeon]|jgi:hypothetical protein